MAMHRSPESPKQPPQSDKFSLLRVVKRFVALVFVGSCCAIVVLTVFQRDLIFPRHAIPERDTTAPVDAETWFTETDEPVEVWFLRGVGNETRKPVVFFAHGNGGLIDHFPMGLQPYRDLGFHVVLVEFRGYGRSKGAPNQDDIVADFVSVYDQVVKRPDVDPKRVVFHGQSIGGGVMAAVAKERAPTRLVMESTFTSIRNIAYDVVPIFWLLILDPFDSESVIRTLDVPTLILHGTRDQIVPFWHGKQLAEVATNATFVKFDAGHALRWNGEYWRNIRTFVAPLGRGK